MGGRRRIMLYNLIMGGLDFLQDTLQYGPIEAVKINTSICPQAERDYREVNVKVQKAIDEAFDKFENTANVIEDGAELPECREKEKLTTEEFAGRMIEEISNFMGGWMSNLYKNNSVTDSVEGDINEG